ncbi:rod-binding protein [Enterobacter hormaechei subsp. steigerwaltii]|nr:rod-binding protein [Enterobacter hormaechei]MDF7706284.1 rod-binding protein [Enterobacter hormaechei subsp. steigerwaltii]
MFTAMHDQQVAQNIAGSGQLGFARRSTARHQIK